VSRTEVRDFQLSRDQITTLTAGIVQTEIIDENWDGKTYWLKARVVTDPDEVIKSIHYLQEDPQKINVLEESRKTAAEILKEVQKIKSLAKGKANTKRIKQYNESINKLSAMDWFEKGLALSLSGNYQEAIQAYDEGLKLLPKYAPVYYVYYNMGLNYNKLGLPKNAIEAYKQAIRINPDYAKAHCSLGRSYSKRGLDNEAIEAYKQAIRIDPDYAEAHLGLGRSYKTWTR